MKKSFLVLICVVFIAAIVTVGLFGLKYKSIYDDKVYPESIDCNKYCVNNGEVTYFYDDDEDYDYYTTVVLDKRTDITTLIELLPTVTPVDAEKDYTFILDEADSHAGISVDAKTGVISIQHKTVIKDGKIRGQDTFLITITSNQDASIKKTMLFFIE